MFYHENNKYGSLFVYIIHNIIYNTCIRGIEKIEKYRRTHCICHTVMCAKQLFTQYVLWRFIVMKCLTFSVQSRIALSICLLIIIVRDGSRRRLDANNNTPKTHTYPHNHVFARDCLKTAFADNGPLFFLLSWIRLNKPAFTD